jgi:hypothetical protein
MTRIRRLGVALAFALALALSFASFTSEADAKGSPYSTSTASEPGDGGH